LLRQAERDHGHDQTIEKDVCEDGEADRCVDEEDRRPKAQEMGRRRLRPRPGAGEEILCRTEDMVGFHGLNTGKRARRSSSYGRSWERERAKYEDTSDRSVALMNSSVHEVFLGNASYIKVHVRA
jgi:hypothetical protein